MSSELIMFDHSFFSDPFFALNDSSIIDLHHDNNLQNIPNILDQDCELTQVDDSCSFDQIDAIILSSSSPPSHHLENLTLDQTSSLFQNGCPIFESGCGEFPPMEVKTEESHHVSFDTTGYGYNNALIVPDLGLGTTENASKFMQRSYSSNSFDNKPNCLFQPSFDSLLESNNFQNQLVSSPENDHFSNNQMRRVWSTGDLHKMKTTQTRNGMSSSPLSTERSLIEESVNMNVGKYSSEERKERIDRYKAKRNQRNFNKTIKYACRKTLADNRPRIRGRFARNDEAVEIPKTSMFNRFGFEDQQLLWVERFHQEEEENGLVVGSAPLFNSFNNMTHKYHHQYYCSYQ